MKITLNGVKLELDVTELIENLDPDAKREIAKCLIWDNETLFSFVDAITIEYAAPFFNSNLFDARLRLQEQMPESTRSVIRILLQEIKQLKDAERRAENWAWEMYHAWPGGYHQTCPRLPEWARSAETTESEVDAALAGQPEKK